MLIQFKTANLQATSTIYIRNFTQSKIMYMNYKTFITNLWIITALLALAALYITVLLPKTVDSTFWLAAVLIAAMHFGSRWAYPKVKRRVEKNNYQRQNGYKISSRR